MVRQGGGGRIINLSSVHGFSAGRRHVHYEATKGGINMFTKALAIELAEHQITVNAIAPGAIEVERYFKTMPSYDPAVTGKKIPLGRVGYPEDVAPLAVFLAGDQAGYITGETILVDGGLIARRALCGRTKHQGRKTNWSSVLGLSSSVPCGGFSPGSCRTCPRTRRAAARWCRRR
jgi:NAD(P)-dependent dehydrogenase (short-subunit alcohol dehydrogenase family)